MGAILAAQCLFELVCDMSLSLNAICVEGGFCAEVLCSHHFFSSWKSQDERVQYNEQCCMETRSADVLIEVRRTFAPFLC